MANPSWDVVEIGRKGWRIVKSQDAPRFRRPRAALSLPTPESGGSLELLKRYVNYPEEDGEKFYLLTVGWLVAALRPTGPYVILLLEGDAGAAKTTTGRIFRSLLDPNRAPLRAEPREPRDLAVAADSSWLLGFDNFSSLQVWQSDALCRIATGAGFSVREHYSDREEVIFQACRPALLTSIEEIATRGDFLDRCVILPLSAIEPSRRMAESYFNREFERDRPQILGALLDAVSTALKIHPTLSFASLPRMADFTAFAAAAMPAIGKKPDDFLDAYLENRADANSLVLEGSKISNYVIDLANEASSSWQGTAKELLDKISGHATEKELKARTWPGGPIAMGNALRRITNNLRKAGVEVKFLPRKGNRREISIGKIAKDTNVARDW